VAAPVLRPAQMQALLQMAADAALLSPQQQVEKAGLSLALLAQQLLDNDLVDRPVVVLAGVGDHGAGALTAARHLIEWGSWVQIVLADPYGDRTGVAQQLLDSLRGLGAPLAWAEDGWELPPADLLIDALVSDPQGVAMEPVRNLVQLANSSLAPVLSLDAPSGLDLSTGALIEPHVRAAATLVLGLPRPGHVHEPGRAACGQLFLADMGLPADLYGRLGLTFAPDLDQIPLPLTVADGQAWLAADQRKAESR
jgi:NAD(P)H-hydrate epimerase